MEKIPDYRIREEDEEETQESLRTLRERMREHRLNKAELYRQQASLVAGLLNNNKSSNSKTS